MIIEKIKELLNINNKIYSHFNHSNKLIEGFLDMAIGKYSFDSQKEYAKLFKLADDKILSNKSIKEKYINKGFYTRTIILKNVAITFKRRKYVLKPEFRGKSNKKVTVFLLDKYFGLEKYQRIDYSLALEIISKVGINFSYQDIANLYQNTGITKQMVFYLIKKFQINDLFQNMISEPEKKLDHNGVIYVENDDGFKNAITKDGVKKKAITLAVIHTGYVSKDSNRKIINNKRLFIQMSNEDKVFNNKKYWQMLAYFIKNNYKDAQKAKIIVVGDGAKKIKIAEKYNKWIFILDRFHVRRRIKDSIRGNRESKKLIANKIWAEILKFDYKAIHDIITNLLINSDNTFHQEILCNLLDYITVNWDFILRWKDQNYIGVG